MEVAVVGAGLEGRSAARYWRARGDNVAVLDKQEGPGYLEGLRDFDLVVRSPGGRPDLLAEAQSVTTSTREFLRRCPSTVCGVTGTKGKGTTSALLTELLRAAGVPTLLGGNIGVPALELLDEASDQHVVVLELSSFQLIDLDISPHVAVCLAVSADHLDWHRDKDEYQQAKANIFRHQRPGDTAIYHAHDEASRSLANGSAGRQLAFGAPPGVFVDATGSVVIDGQSVCKVSRIALPGAHNLENVCAALTAAHVLVPVGIAEVASEVLARFEGLPHRLERVHESGGVTFINDSCSTNPDAAIAAVEAFDQPKILILGGSGKAADYTQLAQTVTNGGVRTVILIGEQGPTIHSALHDAGHDDIVDRGNDFEKAVRHAVTAAQPGDVVLLSPACASYDMFDNYQDRGEQFRRIVRSR